MRKWIPVIIFVAVAIPLLLEGWRSYEVGLRDEYEELVEGVTAPDFEVMTTTGESWRMSASRGGLLVLNAWRSACEPCRDTLPTIEALRTEFSARGVQFVGVSFDQSRPTLEAFLEEVPLSYPVIHDDAGAVAELYGMPPARPGWMAWGASVPQTYLIDQQGMIAGAWSGAILPGSKREREMRRVIESLLRSSRT